MNYPDNFRYTKEHEWAKLDGGKVIVGITHYAQSELGDVVFVDLPAIGKEVAKGKSFCTIESVKAVSDIYSPVDGKVTAVNSALTDHPEQVNAAPHEAGWIVNIEPKNPKQLDELMDASAYSSYLLEVSK